MKSLAIEAVCFGLSVLPVTQVAGQTCRTANPLEQTALQELSDKDKGASISGDWQMLATLWTDDAIALPPGQQPVVGLSAIRTWLQRGRIDTSKVEVSEYSIDIHSTRVCGNTAIQWGTTRIVIKPKGAPAGMRAQGNIERVLRRQTDGSWKVQRAIWNMGKPVPDKPGNPGKLQAGTRLMAPGEGH